MLRLLDSSMRHMIFDQRYQRRVVAQEHYYMQGMSGLTERATKLLLDNVAFAIPVAANVVITIKNKKSVGARVLNYQS